MNNQDMLHEYWKNPPANNFPKKYLSSKRKERSLFLIDILQSLRVKPEASILEIGCNSGRNLMYLWKAGYHDLTGIEINRDAVELMRQKMPYLGANVIVGPVEDVFCTVKHVGVIFTIAVLVHLHPDSEFIFSEMVRKARKYIITIEDETTEGARHHRRNYQKVFEALGMKQIYYAPSVPGMTKPYCARAFKKVLR